jgi:hypothetical protein
MFGHPMGYPNIHRHVSPGIGRVICPGPSEPCHAHAADVDHFAEAVTTGSAVARFAVRNNTAPRQLPLLGGVRRLVPPRPRSRGLLGRAGEHILGGGGDLQQRPVAAAPPGELQPDG